MGRHQKEAGSILSLWCPWEEAIALFGKRVGTKFFAPLQLIIDQRKLQGEGFALVTVQCALVELFPAFRSGMIFNHDKANRASNYEYSKSQPCSPPFSRVLQSSRVIFGNLIQQVK